MTKLLYFIIFLISDMFCLAFFIVSFRSKSRLRLAISNLIGAAGITTTAYMMILVTNYYQVMNVAYSCYYAMMDWLCMAIFGFVLAFTFRGSKAKKVCSYMFPLAIADTVSLLFNIFYGHVVEYRPFMQNGDLYFAQDIKIPFLLHLGFCYLLLAAAFGLLIRQIITETRIYRYQGIAVLAVFLILVIGNAWFGVLNTGIDLSILGYSFGAGLLVVYSIFFLANQLKMQMSGVLISQLRSMVLLFDRQHDLIFENDFSKRWNGDKEKLLTEIFGQIREEKTEQRWEWRREIQWTDGSGTRTLNVRYQKLLDKVRRDIEKPVGSYLIVDDITKERKELLKREYLSSHDELTGLYNKAYFCRKAKQLIRRYPETRYAVALTNVNQFKIYNEVFGKEEGDALLRKIADAFREKVHDERTVYGRYEADRFVACLPVEYCTQDFIERMKIPEPVSVDTFKVVNYIGIAEVSSEEDNIETLCERAAIALNTIKGNASVHAAFYDKRMRDSLLQEKEIAAEFPEALKNGEVTIFVQPQINQSTGSLIGGEALGRWIRPDGTIISPGEFIPVLEKNGMITDMDYYVWDKTCRHIRELQEEGYPTAVSVNISAQDFYRLDLYQVFSDLTEKYDILPKYLRLEITESEYLREVDKQAALMKKLQDKGFLIEMDDFGSGYSSLNTLKDIPVDVLKMDMHFLDETRHAERGRTIIHSVVQMARGLNMYVVAEGVETEEQADFMKSVGCKYIQGYLYGRPMPVEEFKELRRQRGYEEDLYYTEKGPHDQTE